MNLDIHITDDGLKKYPPHKHLHWEIMIYLYGEGFLYTPEQNYPFQKGTMILVPPGVIHGSVSEHGFRNISIGGDFDNMFVSKTPISIQDNTYHDGISIAKLLYRNRFAGKALLHALYTSLIYFLTEHIHKTNDIYSAVYQCMEEITHAAFDSELCLSDILHASGYSEDYIRAKFKEYTGKTPTAFLTEIRINHAKFLIEVYEKKLSLQEIMLQCGFYDYAYFSKKFKQYCGISPRQYIQKTMFHHNNLN